MISDLNSEKLTTILFEKRDTIFTYQFPDLLTSGRRVATSSVKIKKYINDNFPDNRIKQIKKQDRRVEKFIKLLKQKLSKLHGVTDENLKLYISELEFRINHCEDAIFHDLIDLTITPIINQK